eukprot:CAMPEP_0197719996 /NCGR_PEP_ID=MMETSP1434-20131217/3512_1 /TAXON_ID=265543 /ORGANISM="Minutocellus polymorphus, Strain CCMP3303" /LENGTH=217 /DNA_ID=CAMNT_0043304791 /DNA_START=12 /DNA_END=668 /DNA_ORIENTATION=-
MAPPTSATAFEAAEMAEIRQCFDVLDEERTGTITPHGLTTLLRSMGHRVSRDEVMADLNAARERRRRRRRSEQSAVVTDDDNEDEDDDDNNYDCAPNNGPINVELVLDILSQDHYRRHGGMGLSSASPSSSRSSRFTRVAELQQTFRLFDVDKKGIITLDNLRKVADEIYGSETNTASSSGGMIDDELLRSMMETFDLASFADGINFEGFCRIMGEY